MEERKLSLVEKLREFAATIDPIQFFPTVDPAAGNLALRDPYAFAIATCLDRGAKSEIIWTIPFDLQRELGHLDPRRVYRLATDELAAVFAKLPRKPRFLQDAPRTIEELTRIVIEEYDGDASRIWMGRSAAEIKKTFRRIHGVGSGIANMAVLLMERAFSIRFTDVDRATMDIKPDVHTMRVLYRLGVAPAIDERSALESTRKLHPDYPGELDGPLWVIGKQWCRPDKPNCPNCPVVLLCQKVLGDGSDESKKPRCCGRGRPST